MMNDEYDLFDFQYILDLLRSRYLEKAAERKKKRWVNKNEQVDYGALLNTLNSISSGMDVKDMPFYKEYLAKFDIENNLGDYQLKKPDVHHITEADYDLLLRLVFASFSSKYDLIMNDDDTWSLVIKAKDNNNFARMKLEEIGRSTISRLMEIYIGEMFEIHQWRNIDEENEKRMERSSQINFFIFEKKAMILKFEFIRKAHKEQSETLDLIEKLDRLMEI